MRGSLLTLVFVLASAAAGCYTEADVAGGGGVVYAAPAPAMVEISPGVQVISDYDEPIFYTGGLYWRSYGGVWYSSRVYNGGWAVNYNAPYAVRGISNPGAYVHYRAGVNAGYRGGAYAGARGGVEVRDHRTYAAPAARPVARPVVRDHRR